MHVEHAPLLGKLEQTQKDASFDCGGEPVALKNDVILGAMLNNGRQPIDVTVSVTGFQTRLSIPDS